MQKVLTAEQMREVDRLTTEKYGIPSIILMENAAYAVSRVITEKLGGSVVGRRFNILCGTGNNGGDGAALARILWTQGANCFVWLFGNVSDTLGDAKVNFEAIKKFDDSDDTNGPNDNCLILFEDAQIRYPSFVHQSDDFIVDALFGTGLSRPLDGLVGELVDSLTLRKKRLRQVFLAIDIPSGLQSDIGAIIGPVFPADCTVTFTSPKPANILPPAENYNGELVVANIGSPDELIDAQTSHLYLTEFKDAKRWLGTTAFSDSSYKNKRGHALVIAGSGSYSGAAVLCGNAAMRSGVGLVTIATPKSSKDSVALRVLPEVMVRGVAETGSGAIADVAFDELGDLLEKADSLAIGSGLSLDENTKKFVEMVVKSRRQPIIVDADALRLISPFAEHIEALTKVRATDTPRERHDGVSRPHVSKGIAADGTSCGFPLILTPHEGEFMRLLGTDDKDATKDRVAAVRDFATTYNVILVLKGERVLIGEPGGKVVVNPTGNSGLGKAGNGDTLTGILAGFVAQATQFKIGIFETVVAAVYVAGMAGDIAEKKYGKRVMTASDVRECLVEVFAILSEPPA